MSGGQNGQRRGRISVPRLSHFVSKCFERISRRGAGVYWGNLGSLLTGFTVPLFPPFPDFRVPFFSRCSAFSTDLAAAGPYFLLPAVFFLAGIAPPTTFDQDLVPQVVSHVAFLG